jgi:hypothetical protein
MSPTNWNTAVFNSELNDGIVPVASQLNDTSEISGLFAFPGVIHSPGIEALGFSGPSELDSASGIPDFVIDLLNESTNGAAFQH